MAAGATYEPIATTTLGTAAASIDFTGVSSSYTDLRLIVRSFSETGSVYPRVRFNNATTTACSMTMLLGSGSAATSERRTTANNIYGIFLSYSGATTTIPSLAIVDIFNYAGSTNKTILVQTSEDANGSGYVMREVGLFPSTSAITQVSVIPNTGNLGIGTTATLYGIKAA